MLKWYVPIAFSSLGLNRNQSLYSIIEEEEEEGSSTFFGFK